MPVSETRPFMACLWRDHQYLPFMLENTAAQSRNSVKVILQKGEIKVWTQHLLDTTLSPEPGKGCNGGFPTFSPRSMWIQPVTCMFNSLFGDSTLVAFHWDHVCISLFSKQGSLQRACYTRSAQETLLIEGTHPKDFFNHHVKLAANISSMPAYCMLLFKVYFSVICQQCDNPDSTV